MFRCYYKELCRFAITFVNHTDDAEDVVQKCFISLWENRKRMTTPDNEKSFLYKTVYNACLNCIRNNTSRQNNYLNYFLALNSDNNDTDKETNPEIQRKINLAIENLPAKCRQIFILNKIEGLTQSEIADYLEISPKTVENQVANAISKLRIELKPILHLLPGCFLWIL